jgi:hypothetical protein
MFTETFNVPDFRKLKRVVNKFQTEYSINFEMLKPIDKNDDFVKGSPPENAAIFIPAKDMLTHSKGFPSVVRLKSKEMPFSVTLMNIIDKALMPINDEPPELALKVSSTLERIMGGRVEVENDEFYVKKYGRRIHFAVEAEGLKKFGLLWRLLMNESIKKDTILFWDEPEANVNPKLISDLVEVILELSRHGVQIFIATHDYIFAKYVEVKMKEDNDVRFHALYKTENGVKCETQKKFTFLENNSITQENVNLYEAEVKKVME